MENQSWWEPQAGPPSHPGTGKQGHIHVEMCFPLYQTFGATGTIGLDVTVRLHNMPGTLDRLIADTYGDFRYQALTDIDWQCPSADCARTFRIEVPLDRMRYSGLHALMVEAYVRNADGKVQFTVPRWPVYLDNGKPPPPLGSIAYQTARRIETKGVMADSSYQAGAGGSYAAVSIRRADYPWDPTSGQMIPQSGVWTPEVFFEQDTGFAYLDAALHATPPTKTVVYEGLGFLGQDFFRPLEIDTTKLTNGVHKLLIGTCNTLPAEGDHCGTQVIRFLSANPQAGGT